MNTVTSSTPFLLPSMPPAGVENLAVALVAALADLTVIEKAHTAKIEMKGGGHYSYGFADLGDIVKLTRPVLAAHGLVALTPVHQHGSDLACTVILLHQSGERLDLGPFPFPQGRDAQATGSMVTYHRRYALLAALGMATGEDDDGAGAVAAQPAAEVPKFRQSVIDAVNRLGDTERSALRSWLAEEGLPDRPSLMDQSQCDRVIEWLMGPADGEAAE